MATMFNPVLRSVKSSGRISESYLKEPFTIGYPVASHAARTRVERTRALVFPEVPPKPQDYINQIQPKASWDNLSLYQQYKCRELALRDIIKYTQPRPQHVNGFELYRALHSHIKTKSVAKQWWDRKLTDTERLKFESDSGFIDRAFKERTRIWEGYQMVSFLKHRRQPPLNPFECVGLYPWEVVRDKLRQRRRSSQLFGFEIDYYDRLISEAFSRFSRSPVLIFYTDLKLQNPERKVPSRYSSVEQLFAHLSPREKEYYQIRCERRKQHLKTNRVEAEVNAPFMAFVQLQRASGQIVADDYPQLVLRAAAQWRQLTLQEKQQYRAARSPRSSENLSLILERKVEIVMRYIYNVGGVVDAPLDYDWVADMRDKSWDS